MDKAAWKTARRAESRMMDESSAAYARRHLPPLHAVSFLCLFSFFTLWVRLCCSLRNKMPFSNNKDFLEPFIRLGVCFFTPGAE